MKCNYCQAEWTVNSAMSASIKSCPFCGKPIAMAPDDKLGSMAGALKAIIAHSGIDGLRDGKRALAMCPSTQAGKDYVFLLRSVRWQCGSFRCN